MNCVSLQLVHQVEVDELLLDGDALVVDDVGEQPEGLPAEMEIVGGQEGRQDGGEVRVSDQTQAHGHGVRPRGEVGQDPDDRGQELDQGPGVALLEYFICGNVQTLVEEGLVGQKVVEGLVGGEDVQDPEQMDRRKIPRWSHHTGAGGHQESGHVTRQLLRPDKMIQSLEGGLLQRTTGGRGQVEQVLGCIKIEQDWNGQAV